MVERTNAGGAANPSDEQLVEREVKLEQILSHDKRNLAALLDMGEIKAEQGDDRAANAFYKAALNMVSTGARV